MATSPLFGWEEPDDVDLVKDGAAAIRTLGNAIDTSMGDLLGGTIGQVLSKASNTNMDFTWVTSDDANAIQNTIVDEKGDLIAASASDTPARLGVGTNGQVLTADSSASTGLAWATPSSGGTQIAMGKNKIINGDFSIWQRGTSTSTNGVYLADRWKAAFLTGSFARQTFTLGTAPVAGYEGQYFAKWTISSNSQNYTLDYRVEDVRTFAGQTATISFWAKQTTGTATFNLNVLQDFGTGGSPSSYAGVSGGGTPTLTSSWTRYSYVLTFPSIAGKTIGTNNDSNVWIRFQVANTATGDFDIWGVQLEAGSSATTFVPAGGGYPTSELELCQRYYQRRTAATTGWNVFGNSGFASGTTNAQFQLGLPTSMRVRPTSVDYGGNIRITDGGATITVSSIALNANGNNVDTVMIDCGVSGATQYRPYYLTGNNDSTAYVGFSAEY